MSSSDQNEGDFPLLRLHIGGRTRHAGWTCYDISPGPEVDLVGDCRDLSRFEDDSVEEIYASHVLEHLSYRNEIVPALKEWRRVLLPGGLVKISVPDFEVLCRLFLRPDLTGADRGEVLRMTFGGQMDAHDYHRAGLTFELMSLFLDMAGFQGLKRVERLGDFDDTSRMRLVGVPISLNLTARKPLPVAT